MIFSRGVTPRELIYVRLQRWLSLKRKIKKHMYYKSSVKQIYWTNFVQIKFFYFSTKSLSYKLNSNIIIEVEFV